MGISWIAGTGSTGTNPVGHTVGWKGIMIPGQISSAGGDPGQPSFVISPQPTVAEAVFGDSAFVYTMITQNTARIIRRLLRQTIFRPAGVMCTGGNFEGFIRSLPDAVVTNTQGFRYVRRCALTQLTRCHYKKALLEFPACLSGKQAGINGHF